MEREEDIKQSPQNKTAFLLRPFFVTCRLCYILSISICMASRTSPWIARVPHTAKRPERCLHCGSTAITRKGTRKKKIEIVQLWRCSSCKRVFTPTPAALRGKTYPLHIVLDAITLYDLGYSLEQTADKIRARHGHRVGRSTIAAWL